MPITIYFCGKECTMKNLFFVALLCASAAAIAVGPTSVATAAGTPPATATGNGGQGGEGDHEQRFEEHKAELERHIAEHIATIKQRLTEAEQKQSCIQAASNREALEGCMRDRGE
jgi:Spy/CpxP family protein refolding chaperone